MASSPCVDGEAGTATFTASTCHGHISPQLSHRRHHRHRQPRQLSHVASISINTHMHAHNRPSDQACSMQSCVPVQTTKRAHGTPSARMCLHGELDQHRCVSICTPTPTHLQTFIRTHFATQHSTKQHADARMHCAGVRPRQRHSRICPAHSQTRTTASGTRKDTNELSACITTC